MCITSTSEYGNHLPLAPCDRGLTFECFFLCECHSLVSMEFRADEIVFRMEDTDASNECESTKTLRNPEAGEEKDE